ncbi:MAG TPA: tetratricopeptide repeat protein [bacterium]|nr:tetratricopeptide repeat protein [bacterium]HOL47277.1 tetratricopeptide repeat protein [bacterium]HPQ18695.1 tetratricopeptide repeat protein [bacterium]
MIKKFFIIWLFINCSILFSAEQFYKNLFSISEREEYIQNIQEFIKPIPQNSFFYEDNYLLEIKILFENGEYEKLVKKIETEKINLTKPIILDLINYLTAISYYKINNFNSALKYIEKISIDNYLKYGAMIIFYFTKNDLNKTEEYIKLFNSLKYNERYIELYTNINFIDLILSYKKNEFIKCLKKYDEYKKYFYNNEELILNAFKIFYQSSLKLNKSTELLKECYTLTKLLKFDSIKYFEAYIYIRLANYEKAEKILKELIIKVEKEKKDIEFLNILYYRLAEINFLKARYNECINNLNKIINENENLRNYKYALSGYTYYKINKPDLAVSLFEKINNTKNNYYYHKYLVDKTLILFEKNKFEEVINSFNKLISEKINEELLEKNIYYYFYSLNKTNQPDKVIEFYKKNKMLKYDDYAIYEISNAYAETGQNNKAINLLKKLFINLNDDKFRDLINERIGDYYFEQNDFMNSLKYYDKSDEQRVLLKKINIYYITEQNNLALNIIDRYISEIKDETIISKIKSYKYLILLKNKKYKEAEKIINELLEKKYDSTFFYNIFYLYFQENRIDDFSEKFFLYKKKLLNDKNNYLKILKLYTELLIKNMKYEEAINFLEELKKYEEKDIYRINLNIANCYKELRYFNKAKEIFEELLNTKNISEEQREEINYNLAMIYFKKNEIYKSYEYLKNIKKYLIPEKYLLMGDINYNTRNYETARQFYEKIITEFNDSNITDLAQYRMIILNIRNKKYSIAEKNMLLFIENFKSSIYYEKTLLLLSFYYYSNKEYEKALKYIQQIKIDENNFDILNLLKDIYYQQGDFKNSLKICNTLLRKIDEFYKPIILLEKGKILLLNGEFQKSIEIFNDLINKDLSNKETYNYYLANNYLFLNDYKKAEKYFKELTKREDEKYKLLEKEIEYKIYNKAIEIEYDEKLFNELDYLEKIRYKYLLLEKYKKEKNHKNAEKIKNELIKIDKENLYKIK